MSESKKSLIFHFVPTSILLPKKIEWSTIDHSPKVNHLIIGNYIELDPNNYEMQSEMAAFIFL